MNEKHINKSLCESDSTKNPPPCEVESQISSPLRKTESKLSPLVREVESKSPLSCESDSIKSPLPQHEGRLGVGIIPQGYKQTSIGIIPQDWEVVRLGEVFNISSGATPLRQNKLYWENPTIQWVKIGDLNNSFVTTTQEKISLLALEKTTCKLLPKNTLLIAMYGGFNQIGRTGILQIEATTNQAISALITKSDNILPIFANNYLILHKKKWKEFAISSRKDPNITKADVANFQIPLPPLKEQEKIARILDVWYSAIDSLANLIKAKRKYKTALMQRLLTPPKDKSTHPLAPSAREGEQENCSHAREGLSLDSTNCESDFGKSDSTKSPLPCGGGLGVGIKTDKSPSHRPLAPYMKEFSRAMRKNPTQAENKLWQELRGKKLGFGFRRQFVIDSKYIADFVCLEKRLIIECDGGQHNKYESPHPKSLPQGEGLAHKTESKSPCDSDSTKSPLPCGGGLGVGKDTLNHPDIQRDFYLESQNFRILRFWNNEILGNLEGVLCVIKEALESNVDFANAKYTCESTHPLAPSAREGEQENCPRVREGEQKVSHHTNEGESHQSSLRFAGFSDKWQEFRLGDLFEITRGYVLPIKEIRKQQDKQYCYPVYSSQTINGGLMGYYTDYLFEDCITWTTDGANAGEVNFRAGKFYCTNVCGVLISKDGFANKCVAEIINSVSKKYVSYVGNPKLMNNVMSGIKVKIPTLAEQKKIAQVLSACDKEIETLNLKFECLKAQKRGLMQQLLSGKVRVKC